MNRLVAILITLAAAASTCVELGRSTDFKPRAGQVALDRSRRRFAYDGGGLGKGGEQVLFVDGKHVGSARQEASIPIIFSGDETLDIGVDTGTSVSDDYTPEASRFDGIVNWVQLDLGSDDQTHLITSEERPRVAMVPQ